MEIYNNKKEGDIMTGNKMLTPILIAINLLTVSLLSADCKLMALIGTNNNDLSSTNAANSWNDFTYPCLDKLQSLGATNPDGWGLISYDEEQIISGEWRSIVSANTDTVYWDASVSNIQNLNPRIVLGHVRNSTNIEGIPDPHPYIRTYGERQYSFIHNGTVDSLYIKTLINNANPNWFSMYPPTHYPGHGDQVVDSEYYFLWILLNIHQQNGNVLQALKTALLPLYTNNNSAILNFVLSDGLDLYAYRNCPSTDNSHPLAYFHDMGTAGTNRNYYYSGVMTIFPNSGFEDQSKTHQISKNELVYLSSTGNCVRLPSFAENVRYSQRIDFHDGVNWSGFPIMGGTGVGQISMLTYFTDPTKGGISKVTYGPGTEDNTYYSEHAWSDPNVVLTQKQLYKLTFATDSPSIHTMSANFANIYSALLINPEETTINSVVADVPYWISYTLLPSQNIKDAFGDSWSNVKHVRAENWFYSIPPEIPKDGSLGAAPLYSWTTQGKNMDFGKGYIVTFKNNQGSFIWNRSYAPEPLTPGKEKAICFTWDDKPDYVVIDVIDADNAENIKEIGVLQGDICIGAVRTDTLPCQILAYPDYSNPSPLTFSIIYDSKSMSAQVDSYCILTNEYSAMYQGYIFPEVDGLYQVKLAGNYNADNNLTSRLLWTVINYPNPFNPDTSISVTLADKADASVVLYNIRGQVVRDFGITSCRSGINTIHWDGRDQANNLVSSGIYFVRVNAGGEIQTHKMLMMK